MPYVRRLPSGLWQATVKRGRRRYTKTDPLKKVVVEWASDLELQIRRGAFIDPAAGKIRLADWWEIWTASRTVTPSTLANAETHWRLYVQPAFGDWEMAAIAPFEVQQWVARMVAAKVRPTAAQRALLLLRQMLEAAVLAKRIGSNPAAGVKAPRPPKHVDRFLDVEERGRLLDAITMPDPDADPPPRGEKHSRVPDAGNRLFVKLMLDAGLRWQEAAGLHVFRVDLKRRTVRVQEVVQRMSDAVKEQPKSEAGSRVVPLTDELVKDLTAFLGSHPGDGLLFRSRQGTPLEYKNWLHRVWRPAVRAANLEAPLPTPHDCRHSYGSWLAEQGVPPHEIMVLMGHSSLRAVERYIHASSARLQRARDALDARGGGAAGGHGRAPVVRPEE